MATGAGLPKTLSQLAISGVRVDISTGQVSHIPQQPALDALKAGLSYGGYLTPCHNGFHELGATFDRNGQVVGDHDAFCHNRDLLPPSLKDILPAQIALMPNCLNQNIQAALDPFRFCLRRGL